jgi:hypothetical protein
MEVTPTILNLVIKICNIRKQLRWQIRCNYIGSNGEAIFNILFYDTYTNTLKGDIAFEQHTEEIVHFRFAGYESEKPENLTDLLLDLINHEKTMMEITKK